jgi:hypothetical protein
MPRRRETRSNRGRFLIKAPKVLRFLRAMIVDACFRSDARATAHSSKFEGRADSATSSSSVIVGCLKGGTPPWSSSACSRSAAAHCIVPPVSGHWNGSNGCAGPQPCVSNSQRPKLVRLMSCRSLPTKKLQRPSWLTEMQANFSTRSNTRMSGVIDSPNRPNCPVSQGCSLYYILDSRSFS